MSGNRTQTSLWIENDLYFLVKNHEVNLTRWVNDNLRRYFSVSTIEQVQKQVDEKAQELKILRQKLSDMEENDEVVKGENALAAEAWKELQKAYVERRKISTNEDADYIWITGPHNLQRCSLIGKPADMVLKKLKEWYDDNEKD